MKKASAIDFDAKFASYLAGIFGVSAEANWRDYTADIVALNRRIFSIFSCVIFFRSKAVFFILGFLVFDNFFLFGNS
jgi:hypothetical protein